MTDLVHALRRNPKESAALVALVFVSSLAFLYVDASQQGTFTLFLFAPVILAALAFGIVGGFLAALFAAGLIAPYSAWSLSPEYAWLWLDWGIRAIWLGVIGVLVGMLSCAVSNLEGRVNKLRGLDPTTGGPDYESAQKHVEVLLRSTTGRDQYANVTEVRVANFKGLQQRFGTRRMDEVMQVLAERIRLVMPAGAFVSRSAPDSLSVVNSSDIPWNPAEQTQRLRSVRETPFNIDGLEVHTELVSSTVSERMEPRDPGPRAAGGTAPPAPDISDAASRLLARARDALMAEPEGDYHGGTGSFQGDTQLLGEIAKAIEDQEIQVVYQPVLELRSRKFLKLEALPRWHHPIRGPIPPNRFLPLIEHAGMIQHFARWVVEDIVERLSEWKAKQCEPAVYLDLHPHMLHDHTFFGEVARQLRTHDLSLATLGLQIHERHVMSLKGRQLRYLRHLRASGMRCIVDSFHGKHVPLTHLRTLPIDTIKLDAKALCYSSGKLHDPRSIQAIVRMAHDLGLSVIASGLENPTQVSEFVHLGCDELQGSLLAKPIEHDQVEHLMGASYSQIQPATNAEALLTNEETDLDPAYTSQ
ncbi:EAL domain-containing protein [Thioalkalivibrio sp. ALE30]|uniref:EAL domain-containing protein n=1 Tax=Thioalkalivibrio sp. ALE30 TaxID=1158181 RepID=UPI00036454B0